MSDNTTPPDESTDDGAEDAVESKDHPLHEEIAMSRRSVLASLAVGGAAVGYAAGQAGDLEGDEPDGLYAAGIPNLTEQYKRSKYFSAPSSVFDKGDLATGEAAIVTDDFGLAVKDEDGNMEVPPIGSSTQPVPSVTTVDVDIEKQLEFSLDQYNPHPIAGQERPAPISLTPYSGVSNPVVPYDVFSADVDTVRDGSADPFVRYYKGEYHLFAEAIYTDASANDDEAIMHLTSPDGLTWTYDEIISNFDDGTHFAYPLWFVWEGNVYMTPDRQGATNNFEIWKADTFPSSWSLAETAITHTSLSDPTPFYWNGRWWLVARDVGSAEVELHYGEGSASFEGQTWTEHPSSPILSESSDSITGPAGRAITSTDYIDIPLQSTSTDVRLYRISELTTSAVTLSEVASSPILSRTHHAWTAADMHHMDVVYGGPAGRPLVLVDGSDGSNGWQIGAYTIGPADLTLCVPKMNGNQTISNATVTTVDFDDTPTLDLGDNYDTANDQYVVPESGVYRMTANLRYDITSTGSIIQIRFQNATESSDIGPIETYPTAGAVASCAASSRTAYLSEGDKIEIQTYQNSGGDATLNFMSRASFQRIDA